MLHVCNNCVGVQVCLIFFCEQEIFLIEAFYVPCESDTNDKVDFEYTMTRVELDRILDATASTMVQQAKRSLDNVCGIIYTQTNKGFLIICWCISLRWIFWKTMN